MNTSPTAINKPDVSTGSPELYRSQLTLILKKRRFIPHFARLLAITTAIFQKTPGAVKLNFSGSWNFRQFSSHSVWRDRAAVLEFYNNPIHRDSMERAYRYMSDESFMIRTGAKPFYYQCCLHCRTITTGTTPSMYCPQCHLVLPRRLQPPLPLEPPETLGPEYGKVLPDILPTTNLKWLELITAIATTLSTPRTIQVYRILKLTPLLWWLTMIIAPQWHVTRALTMKQGLVAGLSLFYGASLFKAIAEMGLPDPDTSEEKPSRFSKARTGLPGLLGVLADWAHYLAFDLLAGVWIYRTGLAAKQSTRLPLLLLFVVNWACTSHRP